MGPRARVSVWPGCRSVPGIVAPELLGEHAEQNASLATSPDTSLPFANGLRVNRRADVCALFSGSGTTQARHPRARLLPPQSAGE
jgi:hypothetical protein